MVKYDMKSKSFGDRLKEARIEKGYTQGEIADLLGIKQQRYQPWESGRAGKPIEPPHEMLQKLANILDKSVEWLLTGHADRIAEQPSTYGTTIDKIVSLLRDMEEPARRDILKRTEEKKIVTEVMKKKKVI